MLKHIPNLLSLGRILLIPVFINQFVRGNTVAAAILLAVSGLTDLLDGFLARRFGWVTQLGKVLDPVADKLTQASVCILFLLRVRQYWPVFMILLLKDAVMLMLGGYLLGKGVRLQGAKWCGKVSTTVFYVSMAAIILFPSMPEWAVVSMLALTVIIALLSALLYIPEFFRYEKAAHIPCRKEGTTG